MNKFVKWLDDRGSSYMIERRYRDTGLVADYLKRHFLFETEKVSIFLHQFWGSDPDELHDHPSDYIRIRLKGKYLEHFLDGTSKWSLPFTISWRRAEAAHRVELPEGSEGESWSIFIFLKRRRDWGFYCEDGWEPAGRYGDRVNNPVRIRGVDFETKGMFFPKYVDLKKSHENI